MLSFYNDDVFDDVIGCRFYGRICDKEDLHQPATLSAIRDNMNGLKQISGERIWVELKKILAGKFADHLTLKMVELGIGPYIGLPDEMDTLNFKNVHQRLEKLGSYNPITLLSALLNTEQDVRIIYLLLISIYYKY